MSNLHTWSIGNTSESSSQQQNVTCSKITCHEGFYCKEDVNNSNAACAPSCHTWKQYPHATNITIDVLVLLSACIGVVSGVGGPCGGGDKMEKCVSL